MKIPASVRKIYEDQLERYTKLQEVADKLLKSRLEKGWHFESRVKTVESFTLKAESGRIPDLSQVEDFYASTIVVRNGSQIKDAERIVRSLFAVDSRRPKSDTETHKQPDSFPFDDLRLYVRWVDDPVGPPSELAGVLFEVQVKTFLQHAWSIATHDLIYKTDEVSWSRMRIAYQIKAMLEHAELSIQEAANLSGSGALAKSDVQTQKIQSYLHLLTELWEKEQLPNDLRRLAENIIFLAKSVSIDADQLRDLLIQEREEGRGPLTMNLSPYGVIVQTLLNREFDKLSSALARDDARIRILIPEEIDLPPSADVSLWRSAIFVPSP